MFGLVSRGPGKGFPDKHGQELVARLLGEPPMPLQLVHLCGANCGPFEAL